MIGSLNIGEVDMKDSIFDLFERLSIVVIVMLSTIAMYLMCKFIVGILI